MVRVLITGTAGHLGEALAISLKAQGYDVVGIDVLPSPHTDMVGSITDSAVVDSAMSGIEWILHSATLHRPHIESHTRQAFVDVNITGTLNLLEAAVKHGVKSFVFASSTSVFGQSLKPASASAPAVWINESVMDVPKNIYGVTKKASEDMCQLFNKLHKLPTVVLRISRFFLEDDFDETEPGMSPENVSVNEFLNRRVEISDVVEACVLAAKLAPSLGFRRYVISATTPFSPSDVQELRTNPSAVVSRCCGAHVLDAYNKVGWSIGSSIDRVYDNSLAREELKWEPKYTFDFVVERLLSGSGGDLNPSSASAANLSELAAVVGIKGYHRSA